MSVNHLKVHYIHVRHPGDHLQVKSTGTAVQEGPRDHNVCTSLQPVCCPFVTADVSVKITRISHTV